MNTNENDNDIILPCSVNTKHSKENISKIGNVLVILTVYTVMNVVLPFIYTYVLIVGNYSFR